MLPAYRPFSALSLFVAVVTLTGCDEPLPVIPVDGAPIENAGTMAIVQPPFGKMPAESFPFTVLRKDVVRAEVHASPIPQCARRVTGDGEYVLAVPERVPDAIAEGRFVRVAWGTLRTEWKESQYGTVTHDAYGMGSLSVRGALAYVRGDTSLVSALNHYEYQLSTGHKIGVGDTLRVLTDADAFTEITGPACGHASWSAWTSWEVYYLPRIEIY
jgi:hypothetical protein